MRDLRRLSLAGPALSGPTLSGLKMAGLTMAGLTMAAALPAQAEVPRVVTDLPAVAALVQQVMGDLGQPVTLVETGSDAHDYQLRPSQARSLQQAEMLIWIGPEMTPWLERAATSLGGDVARLTLLDLPGTHRQDFGAGAGHHHAADGHAGEGHAGDGGHTDEGAPTGAHGHADEIGHTDEGDPANDDGHGHGEAPAGAESDASDGHDDSGHDHSGHEHAGHEPAGHDHTGLDPHAWLDAGNGQLWLSAIAEALAQKDPENAPTYAANAARAREDLAALDAELAAQLAPLAGKPFVVFHDAYGYFTSHYGLTPAIPLSLGDASTPSAARLAEIRDRISDEGAVCAFPEANHDAGLIAAVIEGTGLRQGPALDPEGSLMPLGPDHYAATLRAMAGSLAECLGQD